MTMQVFIGLCVIVLVLLQHGKGASLGASFGAGSSASMFGPIGASNLLSRSTAVMAAVFFTVSMLIAISGRYEADLSNQFKDTELSTISIQEPKNKVETLNDSDIVPPFE